MHTNIWGLKQKQQLAPLPAKVTRYQWVRTRVGAEGYQPLAENLAFFLQNLKGVTQPIKVLVTPVVAE